MKWLLAVSWAGWKKKTRFYHMRPHHWHDEAAGLRLLQLTSHTSHGRSQLESRTAYTEGSSQESSWSQLLSSPVGWDVMSIAKLGQMRQL